MTEEIWKDIENYEGKYQISNLGRVKSLNYRHTGKEKILKLNDDGHGYLRVSLNLNGKSKNFKVHKLVAKTYIENSNNLPQVNHIDENKQNNCATNLEWCSAKYNKRYSAAKKVGQFRNNKLIKIWDVLIDVENKGFKKSAVCRCCQGKLNSHHGFIWRYLED